MAAITPPARSVFETSPEKLRPFLEGLAVRVSGGRVLCVTALADSIRRAQQAAYDAVNQTFFEGRQFRRDIGWRAVAAGKRHD